MIFGSRTVRGISHHTPHAMSASAEISVQFPVTQFQYMFPKC